MKKYFNLAVALLFCAGVSFGQNEKYTQAMTASIEELDKIDRVKPDTKALLEIANRFERIAAAEPKEWLPDYYAAYCNIILGFYGKDVTEKDQYLDKAATDLKAAEAIVGKPADEILILRAYEAQGRLAADPMNRWQKYGAEFTDFLAAAKGVNPENPRIYYLEGSSLFFTPEEYGGGKKVAKPLLDKAMEKFSVFKPESSIAPKWGKMETEWMLSQTK